MIKNLKEMLYKSAEIYGDKNAYKVRNSENNYKLYTYSDVKNIVDALGSKLIKMGLKNKRIAIIGENIFEWEMSYLAIACGVGIVVPLDKSLPFNELCNVIKRSEVEAIFFSKKYAEGLLKIRELDNALKYLICMDQVENNEILLFEDLIKEGKKLLSDSDTDYISAEIDSNKMGMMLFTSGTTSQSKIVALSHENICSNLIVLKERLKTSSEDVFLSVLPIHHVFECTVGFLLALYSGAENPKKNFMPCPGKINGINFPGGNGVRIDSSIYEGYTVPPYYDSMLAKIITQGSSRNEAIAKMKRCLEELVIDGVDTNQDFLYELITNPDFIRGNFDTSFVEKIL